MSRTAARFAAFTIPLVLGLAAAAHALNPVNKSLLGSLALDGYDPVGYFTEGRPVEGSKAFTHDWNGATWRFASAANRDLFAAEPAKYAPQYGGYCAWAVAHGYTADADPEAWAVVDGKLYLNYDKKVQAKWQQDVPALIAKANENWPKLLAK
jgi:hypothetical protein